MDHGLASAEKNAVCTKTGYSNTAAKGTCNASRCIVGITQESVTGCKDVFTDSERLWKRTRVTW